MTLTHVIKDETSFIRISDSEYHYSCGYYSNNSWVDENNIVLSKSKNIDFKEAVLVIINLETGEETVLLEEFSGTSNHVVYGSKVYYIYKSVLYGMDINDNKSYKICECEKMGFPHMTNDGKYLNWEVQHSRETQTSPGRPSECYVVELDTGKFEKVFEKEFAVPFYTANHMMICPTDPNKIFFSHEGVTYYVSNRLWIYEKGKGERCIAKQNLDNEGNLADCFGHESWGHDGKGVYFVKYPCSPTPPRGISYVDLEGNQKNAIYSKYDYWHVCCSPNGKYLAADTQDGTFSGVCLIDTETAKEKMIAKAGYTWTHPCHPHPAFSPKSEKVCFNDLADGILTVGICNIKDVM